MRIKTLWFTLEHGWTDAQTCQSIQYIDQNHSPHWPHFCFIGSEVLPTRLRAD